MDGLHLNSSSVLINIKRHGQRKPNREPIGSGSFECSKQSILSSMDKFVRTVQSMRSTVLVPSKLRDMRLRPRLPDCQITLLANSAAGHRLHHPGATGQLSKTKAFNSPSFTGKSSSHRNLHSHFRTTHYHHSLIHHLPDNHSRHSSIRSSTAPASDSAIGTLNYDPAEIPSALMNVDLYNFYSMLYEVKQQLLLGPASGQSTIFTNYNANYNANSDQRKPANQTNSCSSPVVARRLMNVANQADVKLNDSAISSSCSVDSSSSVDSNNNVSSKLVVNSPPLKTPQSDSDLELELESDSILTDRTSEPNTDQTQLLVSAFRHHLQALHTILDQMTHSAEYLSRNYELDLDEGSG